MSKNIISDDRNAPKWRNVEGDVLPRDWQIALDGYLGNSRWMRKGQFIYDKDHSEFIVFRKE